MIMSGKFGLASGKSQENVKEFCFVQSVWTLHYNVDILNICMKEFGLEKLIFDKMTAVRTMQYFPNKAFVYA